ncbi:MAG TPA: translation factor GTPase family protein [Streptosporangiaceae bacterium]|nr:translation factor GTPase family protein [Streptosporangiaceae bacterium]
MSRKTLNLGILAHVDAGKTTLTERLLFTSGVIEHPGSVDAGTTLTDSLPLERRRGITIKSAVASFPIGSIDVNLIDTPGHPDFIAEVDRVLSVLDGVVLVVSAVEGVQPQTRVLMRSLERLRIPALLFVNKIDRSGARPGGVFDEVSHRLKVAAVAMGRVDAAGTRGARSIASGAEDAGFTASLAEVLAERDDGLLAVYLRDEAGIPYDRLRTALAAATRRAQVHPVFFGSAVTGAGVEQLMAGIAELLPASSADAGGPVSGSIFKIERGSNAEKIAYVRMFSGTVRIRDRLRFGAGLHGRVTAVAVFERGPAVRRPSVKAGQIGQVWGLTKARIGDPIGEAARDDAGHQFPPPTLESAVVPRDPGDRQRLRAALGQLAEQDPLINLRQDDEQQEIYVSLYGEVQKEVIGSVLADDFGLAVTFRETRTIYIERPGGTASALEVLQSDDHPYSATVGLRIEPGPAGSGIEFGLDVDSRLLPLYIYKTTAGFTGAMAQYVRHALEHGPCGWQVTDCIVTMNDCGYYIGDGPSKRVLPTPRTTAADFRKLTPLVLMEALRRAGTVVCEPMASVRVELPVARTGAVLSCLARLGADVQTPLPHGDLSIVLTALPSAKVRSLQQQLPGLTGGEGVLEAGFGGYRPVRGRIPSRQTSL